jgi:hypothetical protein
MRRQQSLMLLSVASMMGSDMAGWGPCFPGDFRPSAHGIPWHRHQTQRQRRKLQRRTRPHGWKGGAE